MNRRLVVRPSAERDLTAAATYYFEGEGGGERGLALASRFVAAIRASLTAIAETPLAWPLVTRTKRKYLVSVHDRFPFVIYYVVSAEEIAVVAILTARATRRRGSVASNAGGQQQSATYADSGCKIDKRGSFSC